MTKTGLRVFAILVFIASPAFAEAPDLSCSADTDCAIKDVGSCCGYRPRCVNKSARVNPMAAKRNCPESAKSAVCGYPAIKACKCDDGQCRGVSALVHLD